MSSPSLIAVGDDGPMSKNSSPGPRAGGPTPRRSFTPKQKLEHLAAYEDAISQNGGGAYLREQGIYSSQITEWRKLRDAGVLQGKKPGEKIGRLTPEQAEIARLRRQLDLTERRLATTGVALEIMSKMHELLESLSKSSRDETPQTKP
ncbi:transposase [Glaciihabitans sp. UYNi722]